MDETFKRKGCIMKDNDLMKRAKHFISNWMWHSEERATIGLTWTPKQMKDVQLMIIEQMKLTDKAESKLDKLKEIIEIKMKEFYSGDCDKWNFCIWILNEIEKMQPKKYCKQCGGAGGVIASSEIPEENIVCPKCKGTGREGL
jgi:hypothetical protein